MTHIKKLLRMWKLFAAITTLFLGVFTFFGFKTKDKAENKDDGWLKKWREIYQSFNKKYASERVYLHLDKPFYKPDEAIWFQAYVQDEQTLAPSTKSDILYVELIDPKGNKQKEIKLILEEGTASGDFVLPKEAPGGLYKVKAYTQWQKNFDEELLFEKEITVQKVVLPRLKMKLDFAKDAYGKGDEVAANLDLQSLTNEPLSNQDFSFVVSLQGKEVLRERSKTSSDGKADIKFDLPKDLNTADGLLNVLISHNGQTESISRSIPIKNLIFDLQFFPEGGDLVAGTRSNVAFWAEDEFGKPADVDGVVLNSKGKKIATFSSFHKGMGMTSFSVQEEEKYTAKITRPKGVEKMYELPEVLRIGYGLQVEYAPVSQIHQKNKEIERDYQTDNLKFVIYSPVEEELYLTATVRHQPVFSKKVKAKKGENTFFVDTKTLPVGVAQFTLFDSKKIERTERLVFINADKHLNIRIKTNKKKYQPREKVVIDIEATDHRGIPMPANLSLSVVDDKLLSFADDKSSTILSHLLLEADLKGEVEEPRFYFDEDEIKAAKARDLLMLTQGWRKFSWKEVQNPSLNLKNQPEKAIIAGQVFRNGKQVKSATVKIAGTDFSTTTDTAGYFEFRNVKLYEPITLSASSEDKTRNASLMVSDYSTSLSINMYDYSRRMRGVVGGAVPNQPIEEMEFGGAGDDFLAEEVLEAENAPVVAAMAIQDREEKEAVKKEEINGFVEADQAQVADKPIADSTEVMLGFFGDIDIDWGENSGEEAKPQYYRARIFPKVDYSEKQNPESRTDFRSTIFWSGNINLDNDGKAKVEFYNSDEITSFRITCEGVATDGSIGRQEEVFFTQLPFSLDAKIPLFMSMGDKISIPLVLQNNTSEEIAGYVSADYPSAWIPVKESNWKDRTVIEPNSTKVINLDFLIENKAGKGKFIVQFVGKGNIQDRLEQDVIIFEKGFPAAVSFSGAEADQTFSFSITNPVIGTSKARFTAFPSVVDDLLAGIESILREPYGCFEQTSSSTYPNLLVLDYLSTHENLSQEQQEAVARAKKLTEKGYKRLVSYETEGDGYEWFGANPPHEALTAYGLMEFKDMQAVTDGLVSNEMVERTANWLFSRKDGEGGFKRNPKALDSFGRADKDITDAYIVYSLSEAGYQNIRDEVEAVYKKATVSDDPYLIALLTNTLQNLKDQRSEQMLQKLVSLQTEDKVWEGKKHSVTYSQGNSLTIETTSLALLALMKADNQYRMKVQDAVSALVKMRSPYGGFGSTQSTVLALKTLTTYAKYAQRTIEDGDIEIYINQKRVASAHYEADEKDAIEVNSLEKYLKKGLNTIRVKYVGVKAPLPYTFMSEWHTDLPQNNEKCAVSLENKLDQKKTKVGETVRMTSVITNKKDEGQPMTIAVLGIPGGLSPQPWQLKELIEKQQIAFYEIRNHSVVLYWRDMKPSETKTINLDLKADLAGEYEGAASCAYLYYTPEFKDWKSGLSVQVD